MDIYIAHLDFDEYRTRLISLNVNILKILSDPVNKIESFELTATPEKRAAAHLVPLRNSHGSRFGIGVMHS